MAGQNSSLAFSSARSHASAHRSDRPKRARTRHACNECRRSQKRCDGQKPLCARCKTNGTSCSYTPHKARNQCVCTGPDAKEGLHELIPEVLVFNQESVGSATFHTGTFSTSNSSQEQLPGQAGLLTPSPTSATHDEMQEPSPYYVAGQQANMYYMTPAHLLTPAPLLDQPQFHNAHMQVHAQRNNIYSHRSHSVPNVSTTLSHIAPAPFISPPAVSTSLPHYSFEQSPTSDSFSSPFSAQEPLAQYQLSDSPTSLNDNLMSSLALEAGTGMNDFASNMHTQHGSEINVNQNIPYPYYLAGDRPVPTTSYDANLVDQSFAPVDAHGREELPSHLYGAGSVSTASNVTPQHIVYNSLLFHDDGVQANQIQTPVPSYYDSNEFVSNQFDLGMQPLHSQFGYQSSPSSRQENFSNSHTPSPHPPATPTDATFSSYPHAHVQTHPHNQVTYPNEQSSLFPPVTSTSHRLRWPSSSPVTVNTGVPVIDIHTDGSSAAPSPTSHVSYGSFDYPGGGLRLHGQWSQ